MNTIKEEQQALAAANLKADLQSHHIEGYAHQSATGEHFSIPLITQVKGNLWQGGCVDGVNLQGFFKAIISLYPWEQYHPGGPLDCFLQLRLYDSGTVPDPKWFYSTARLVNACVENGPTLVHCQAGLNRSALIAGLSLVIGGMEPEDVVKLLRTSRGTDEVLCNGKFRSWLLQQKPGGSYFSPSPSKTAE